MSGVDGSFEFSVNTIFELTEGPNAGLSQNGGSWHFRGDCYESSVAFTLFKQTTFPGAQDPRSLALIVREFDKPEDDRGEVFGQSEIDLGDIEIYPSATLHTRTDIPTSFDVLTQYQTLPGVNGPGVGALDTEHTLSYSLPLDYVSAVQFKDGADLIYNSESFTPPVQPRCAEYLLEYRTQDGSSSWCEYDPENPTCNPDPVCGNDILEGTEQCDDGNRCRDGSICSSEDDCTPLFNDGRCIPRGGDGCSENCETELEVDMAIVGVRSERDESSFDRTDGISFYVEVENVGDVTIPATTIALAAESEPTDEYPVSQFKPEGGFGAGDAVRQDVEPGETVEAVISGGYLLNSEKTLDANFTFRLKSFAVHDINPDNDVFNIDILVPTLGACGDGEVNFGEECDDGNTDNDDGCDESCLNEEVIDSEGPSAGTLEYNHQEVQPIFNLPASEPREVYRFKLESSYDTEVVPSSLGLQVDLEGLQKLGANRFASSDFVLKLWDPVAQSFVDQVEAIWLAPGDTPQKQSAIIFPLDAFVSLAPSESHVFGLFIAGTTDSGSGPSDDAVIIQSLNMNWRVDGETLSLDLTDLAPFESQSSVIIDGGGAFGDVCEGSEQC